MANKDTNLLPLCLDKTTLPSQNVFNIDGFKFFSNFDSGNLFEVEKAGTREYNLWIANDCQGSQSERQQSSWFYFGMEGYPKGQRVTFNIKNFNKQCRLLKEGMLPVYKSVPSMTEYRRVTGPTFNIEQNQETKKMQFSFCFEFPNNDDTQIYFAYTFPWSLNDTEIYINDLFKQNENNREIYLHKELIMNSPEGRPMDLITLTSYTGITGEKEPNIATLFPENDRPYKFLGKEYVWVSCRVHPGEVPASHMLNGLFRYLLKTDPKIGTLKEDTRIKMILDNFVFLIVPHLNPDGVYRGHYRVSTYGQNLNRWYKDPTMAQHPSCYMTNQILESINKQKKLFMYLDQHAHASYKNCFIFGNHLPYRDHIESCLFGKLMDINCKWFDYESCNFLQKNMYATEKGDALSKEGTGRVSQHLRQGIARSYTLEVNYNMCVKLNKKINRPCTNMDLIAPSYTKDVPPNLYENLKENKEEEKEGIYHFYSQEDFEAFGKGVCISLQDLIEKNPNSRLSRLPYGNLNGLKIYMGMRQIKEVPFRFDIYLRNLIKKSDKEEEQKLQTKYILFAEKDENPNNEKKEQAKDNKAGYVIRTQTTNTIKNKKHNDVKSKVFDFARPSTKKINVIEKKETKQEPIPKKMGPKLYDVLNDANLMGNTFKYDPKRLVMKSQVEQSPNIKKVDQSSPNFSQDKKQEQSVHKNLLMSKSKNRDWNNYDISETQYENQKDLNKIFEPRLEVKELNVSFGPKKNKASLQDTPTYYMKKKDVIITRNSALPKSANGHKNTAKIITAYEHSHLKRVELSNKRNKIKSTIIVNHVLNNESNQTEQKPWMDENLISFTNMNATTENKPTIFKSPSSRNSSQESRLTHDYNKYMDNRPFHQLKDTIIKSNNFKITNKDPNYNSLPICNNTNNSLPMRISHLNDDTTSVQYSTSREPQMFKDNSIVVNKKTTIKNQLNSSLKKKVNGVSKFTKDNKKKAKSNEFPYT